MISEITEQFFKQSTEFAQKASQMFFGIYTQAVSEDATKELYTWWTDHIQELFKNAANTYDTDFYNHVLQKSLQNSILYMNMMGALLQSARPATDGDIGDEQFHEAFEESARLAWEWYQDNIGKYLNAAQLGFERENLMKVMVAVDAYNKFLGAMWDFSKQFKVPFQQAVEKFQTFLEEREKDEQAQSTKDLYKFLISLLTEQYDDFLKSPEGVKVVVDVLHKYVEYRQQLNVVIEMGCKSLSIPTKREMEEVYKDLYHLKKKARHQEAVIQEQHQVIKSLNQKIQDLETSIKTPLSRKKSSTKGTTRRRTSTAKATAKSKTTKKQSRIED